MSTKPTIVLRNTDRIGSLDAESDLYFLRKCFVDNGYIDILADTQQSRSLIVARTGAGKSALLLKFKDQIKNSTFVDLENHYLKLIENTGIAKICEERGASLDKFFIVIWQHIFLAELIRAKYHHQHTWKRALQNLQSQFTGNTIHQCAIKYLEQDTIWKTNVEIFQELSEKVTEALNSQSTGGVEGAGISIKASVGDKVETTSSSTSRVKPKIDTILDSLQLKELSEIFRLLDTAIFNNSQNPFYLIIDKLDEPWIQSHPLRLSLLKAMLDTIRKYRAIPNIKIIAAMRNDLFEQVMDHTALNHQQREKVDSMTLSLEWTEYMLECLISERITFLFKNQYHNADVTLRELIPSAPLGVDPFKYILSQTFHRPRDCIAFINTCISQSGGRGAITLETLTRSIPTYSQDRLKALQDEWSQKYPEFNICLKLIKNLSCIFTVNELVNTYEDSFYLLAADAPKESGLYTLISDSETDPNEAIKYALSILYHVGAIGLFQDNENILWSYRTSFTLSPDQIMLDSEFLVHPMLHIHLNIKNTATTPYAA